MLRTRYLLELVLWSLLVNAFDGSSAPVHQVNDSLSDKTEKLFIVPRFPVKDVDDRGGIEVKWHFFCCKNSL